MEGDCEHAERCCKEREKENKDGWEVRAPAMLRLMDGRIHVCTLLDIQQRTPKSKCEKRRPHLIIAINNEGKGRP